jgi:hypothetical protein
MSLTCYVLVKDQPAGDVKMFDLCKSAITALHRVTVLDRGIIPYVMIEWVGFGFGVAATVVGA